MKKLSLSISILLYMICCTNFYAQEEKEKNKFKQPIQEFFFSEPVYLQEAKEFQQTLGGAHLESDGEISNMVDYEAEYGITQWLQITAGYSFEHHNIEQVPFDAGWLETGAAVGLFNNSKHAATLFLEGEFPVKKPEVDEVETEDSPAYTPAFIYAVQFYKTQLHLNAGAEIQTSETTWFYNAAAVYGEGNIHPVLEINAISQEDFNWFAGTGLVLNGESNWEFGAGVRHGISNSKWNANLHLIYEFTFGTEVE